MMIRKLWVMLSMSGNADIRFNKPSPDESPNDFGKNH